jgi:hypothetical protein
MTDQATASSGKAVIWIVNPFDQVPNETDVPLRYWALCRAFAAVLNSESSACK